VIVGVGLRVLVYRWGRAMFQRSAPVKLYTVFFSRVGIEAAPLSESEGLVKLLIKIRKENNR